MIKVFWLDLTQFLWQCHSFPLHTCTLHTTATAGSGRDRSRRCISLSSVTVYSCIVFFFRATQIWNQKVEKNKMVLPPDTHVGKRQHLQSKWSIYIYITHTHAQTSWDICSKEKSSFSSFVSIYNLSSEYKNTQNTTPQQQHGSIKKI